MQAKTTLKYIFGKMIVKYAFLCYNYPRFYVISGEIMNSKLKNLLSMAIFGTVGIVRVYLPFTSAFIAFVRGAVGAVFLFLYRILKKQPLKLSFPKKEWILLIISGALIGLNWILLFESYKFTGVAVATVCYYMAPIILIPAGAIFLKEKITPKKVCCIFTALLGVAFISGIFVEKIKGIKGIILALCAATLYAFVIIVNKKIKTDAAPDRTVVQLAIAALTVMPYALAAEPFKIGLFTVKAIILLLVLGIVHTGLAYVLYFGSITKLPAQTVAMYSYTDPLVAVILSAIILKEPFSVFTAIGAVLVIGSAMVSEINLKNKIN